jgi:hypothetical protein
MDGMVEDEEVPRDGSLGCPYIGFRARACYKEEVPLTEGSRAQVRS